MNTKTFITAVVLLGGLGAIPQARAADPPVGTFTDFHSPWGIYGYDPVNNRQFGLIGDYPHWEECVQDVGRWKSHWPKYILYCLPDTTVPVPGAGLQK
jgi:hypothetical protein